MDILCVGTAAYDVILDVPYHPEPDEKMSASAITQCGGGPAANAAVAAARLGCRSAFAGYLGNDFYGEGNFAEFNRDGVETRLIRRGEFPTPLSLILVKPDGKRTVMNYAPPHPSLSAGDLTLKDFLPQVILFDGHEPAVSPPLAREARRKGISTVLDAGSVHPGTQDLLPLVDFAICSEKFAKEYTRRNEPPDMLDALALYNSNVVITFGEKGVWWKRKKDSGNLPAFEIQAVDTTGAGDAFHGAFCVGLIRGMSWRENLRFCCAVAALTCTKTGGRLALPVQNQVERFLRHI